MTSDRRFGPGFRIARLAPSSNKEFCNSPPIGKRAHLGGASVFPEIGDRVKGLETVPRVNTRYIKRVRCCARTFKDVGHGRGCHGLEFDTLVITGCVANWPLLSCDLLDLL
eukprot:3672731-Amphidinium_carterae.1